MVPEACPRFRDFFYGDRMKHTIQLTPRLRAAADWVEQGAVLCDVGTDHAHLPAALLLGGRIDRAIASDIRPGPLERAENTARRYALTGKIDLRLCAGLEGVSPGEVDTVTICGMGGEMICGILDAAPWTKKRVRLILQPQRSQKELRCWLAENGYEILRERVVQEGQRWYTLILAEGGEEKLTYSPAAELAGHPARWTRERSRLGYLTFLMEKTERLLQGMERSAKPEDIPRWRYLWAVREELRDWQEKLEKGEWPE